VARWRVQLKGEKFDLEDLPELFTAPDLRVVEQEATYFLEAAAFDALQEAGAVQRAAQRLLPMINGAARLQSRSFRNVSLGSRLVESGAEGEKQHQVLEIGTATVRHKASALLVRIGGEEPEPPAPGSRDTDKWLGLAATDKDVEEAVKIWGDKPHDWFHLYKILEIIQARADIPGSGWASAKDVKRFTWTANHQQAAGEDARHARLSREPPPRPMTLSEADALIERILKDWMHSMFAP
jgi:hypothetical protein